MNIPFNQPTRTGREMLLIKNAYSSDKWSGDGYFTKQCHSWLTRQSTNTIGALLTPSCTAALELAAILIDIQAGDEVIMPSYTFVSTANAFVLRGAKIVFVDIEPETMNLDSCKIEAAITPKTKAIVPVHYAGVGCDMGVIMNLAKTYNLWVIEDAAQAVMASYDNQPLGCIGHLGCYSFHETKNYTSGGEGGALLINDARLMERAMIIREKGTNRSQFLMGQVDKYSWVDIGSSFLPGEFQAACLLAQLEEAHEINLRRLEIWSRYYHDLLKYKEQGWIELQLIPDKAKHNAHLFYCKLPDMSHREKFIDTMKQQGVQTAFHYVPLHSSLAGKRFGRFHGTDKFTTNDSLRLCRLPLWYNMTDEAVDMVLKATHESLERLFV